MLVSLVNEELIKLFGKSEKLNLVTKKPVFHYIFRTSRRWKNYICCKNFLDKEHFIKEKYKILIAPVILMASGSRTIKNTLRSIGD